MKMAGCMAAIQNYEDPVFNCDNGVNRFFLCGALAGKCTKTS